MTTRSPYTRNVSGVRRICPIVYIIIIGRGDGGNL